MTRAVIGTYLRADQVRVVESAADRLFDLRHRDSIRALAQDSALGAISGVLVSAERMEAPDIRAIASLRADFPVGEVVGFTTDAALHGVLRLGRAGVSRLIDMRTNAGPGLLRAAFDGISTKDAFGEAAVKTLLAGVRCRPSFARELELAFDLDVKTTREMARRMGIHVNTLTNRHYRTKIPSAKQYLAHARLAWAAHYGESKGINNVQMAFRMKLSSSQAWWRMVRDWSGMSAAKFYERWNGESYVAFMREAFIDPYVAQIHEFDPSESSIYGAGNGRSRLKLVPDRVAA